MIGVSCPAFCEVPFLNMLEQISEHFRLWEILSEDEDRLELIRDGIRYGRESLGMSFQVHAPMSDVNIGSVHEPMRLAALNEVKQTILMCHQLEIPLVTFHPGFVNGAAFLNKQKVLDRTKDSVKELASFARANSVTIVVENMPSNINASCTTAAELLEVADCAGLGICFDMGHANTSAQVDEFLVHVARFGNVHLHNNAGMWDQHNLVDDGTADIHKVMGVLRRAYRGNLVIESMDLETGVQSKRKLEAILGDLPAP